jgi:hypothetical protein
MLNPILTKAFTAGGAIPAFSIVKFGADDRTVVVGAAVSDFLIGVSTSLPAASGERVDVYLAGSAEVVLAGTVTRGDYVTSNAAGAGVAAAPAAGTNNRVIGIALASGVSGDVIPVLLQQSRPQG